MTRPPYYLAIGAIVLSLIAIAAAIGFGRTGRTFAALLVTAVGAAQALTALRIMIRREWGA